MDIAEKSSVLIVDDEGANIIALTHILSPEYTIYAAKNGPDAIETAKEFLPDLILLDILMPDMDGFEVFSMLKTIDETQPIPVIFVTGLSDTKDEEKGMALGAKDYITKPFSPEIVKLRVRNQMYILNQIKMIKQSSIVENSPHFIMYLSPDGNLSYVNPAASILTGHSAVVILSGGLEFIFDTGTAKEIKNKHIPDTLQNKTASFEVNMKNKEEGTRILAFTSFTAENGNIGAIGLDVTEIRALEAELITAKEQAEHSNQAKNEFLSRMSHEMLTPMHAIIGLTQIIKNSGTAEQKAECLDEINSASRQLLQLINNVLDISSLEKNTLALESTKYSFNTMLSNVLKILQPYVEEKKQTISSTIDPRVPDALIGDEKRLAQVIRYLLMNANKFSPANGVIQLLVCVSGAEGETVELKIEVSDNGIGIAKEKQLNIFTMFEQADGGLSRKYEGAGLGLAISKHLVEMMSGRIWFESEPGKGSKFSFTVKVKNAESAELLDKENK